jgi:alpha-amylase
MTTVCFYFQVHQPYRIRRYSFFEKGVSSEYFDEKLNREVMCRVAERCYLPANQALLRAIERSAGSIHVAFSITGTAVSQMREYAPEALDSFRALAHTGCVEFLSETYHHSLAALGDQEEFRAQVMMHREMLRREFGVTPTVFRNTELIYSDRIGELVADCGYSGVLAEGVADVLGWRTAHDTYNLPGSYLRIIPKSSSLSDDIAFRFTSGGQNGGPLTVEAFIARLKAATDDEGIIGLFMDYETFGEHHSAESGILDFLERLPEAIMRVPGWQVLSPAQVLERHSSAGDLSYQRYTSWADEARDVSAWCGNSIQRGALKKAQAFIPKSDVLKETWRRLQSSDHFYYMSTKAGPDGDVHSYFSPFDSPYEAFISYVNVLSDLASR